MRRGSTWVVTDQSVQEALAQDVTGLRHSGYCSTARINSPPVASPGSSPAAPSVVTDPELPVPAGGAGVEEGSATPASAGVVGRRRSLGVASEAARPRPCRRSSVQSWRGE